MKIVPRLVEAAPKEPSGWTKIKECCDDCPKTMITKMRACNGGIYKAAKKANGDKDVKIANLPKDAEFGGQADLGAGKVSIRPNPDVCQRVQTLIFELNNIARQKLFFTVSKNAAAGKLSRTGYIRGIERVEYGNARKLLKVHKSCKSKWCCEKSLSRYAWMEAAKDFDDYFDNYLAKNHKENYGDFWDKNYKAIYTEKHPVRPSIRGPL